jgi:hypothetical protein
MHGQPIAIQMAARSTRRHVTEPPRERSRFLALIGLTRR